MKIYHYDSSNKFLIGFGNADPDPLVQGSFLIPAFATEVEPPQISSDQVAFWNGSKWELKNIPEPEPIKEPEKPKLTWERIRNERNYLLSQTDWIFAPDITLKNKEAWLTYRQALRDLPQTFSTPEEVVFPNKPQ